MARILTGIQSTGVPHLGNILGAIIPAIKRSKKKGNESFLFIADLHALIKVWDPDKLNELSKKIAMAWLASGLDASKTFFYRQSDIPEITDLAWILSCHTPIGWLNRMTQFKDKAGKNKEKAPLGLYSYPVLMAADILLYKSEYVPVGEDQKQHLELSRDIAQSFNRLHENDFFPIPEPLIMGLATRVMSLKDGTKKMSKSDPSDYSRINMTDNTDDIRKKIQKAKTDSLPFPDNCENLESRPEINNLLNIFCSMSEMSMDKIIQEYSGKDFKKFKEDLFEVINIEISKVSIEMQKLLSDKSYLENLLKEGAEQAREIADNNIREIKELINFYDL